MTSAAGTINLTRSNASQADPWTFLTPDRSIAIPHCNRRAGEGFTCGYRCQKEE
jgi:hypothetical protein